MTYLLVMCYQLTPEFDGVSSFTHCTVCCEVGSSEGWFQLLHLCFEVGSSEGWFDLVHHAFWSRRVGGLVPRTVGPVFHYHFLSEGRSSDNCWRFFKPSQIRTWRWICCSFWWSWQHWWADQAQKKEWRIMSAGYWLNGENEVLFILDILMLVRLVIG